MGVQKNNRGSLDHAHITGIISYSNNSSRSPSRDGLHKSPRINTKLLPEKSKKPSGRQVGHVGETLKQVTHPEKIIKHLLHKLRSVDFMQMILYSYLTLFVHSSKPYLL